MPSSEEHYLELKRHSVETTAQQRDQLLVVLWGCSPFSQSGFLLVFHLSVSVSGPQFYSSAVFQLLGSEKYCSVSECTLISVQGCWAIVSLNVCRDVG